MPALVSPQVRGRCHRARLGAPGASRSTSRSASRCLLKAHALAERHGAVLRGGAPHHWRCEGAACRCARAARGGPFYEQLAPKRTWPVWASCLQRRCALQGPLQRGAAAWPPSNAIFTHMFTLTEGSRASWCMRALSPKAGNAFLSWDFHLRAEPRLGPGAPMRIHGGSLLRFAARRPRGAAPRLLGRRRGAVREAAADRRSDALAAAAHGRVKSRRRVK